MALISAHMDRILQVKAWTAEEGKVFDKIEQRCHVRKLHSHTAKGLEHKNPQSLPNALDKKRGALTTKSRGESITTCPFGLKK